MKVGMILTLLVAMVVICTTAVLAQTSTGVADASYVTDVTVPDDTVLEPGDVFQKVWRMKNSGDCTWDKDYALAFVQGDQLGARDSELLDKAVAAGETVDIAVKMTAPDEPGTYTSWWQIQDTKGKLFGQKVYVRVVVGGEGAPVPAASPSVTSTVSTITETTTLAEVSSASELPGHLVWEVRNSDPTKVSYDVYVSKLDGTESRLLWQWGRQPRMRDYDGRVALNGDGPDMGNLCTVDLDGSNVKSISLHGEDAQPYWSPYGDRLVFATESETFGEDAGRMWTIWIQNNVDEPTTRVAPRVANRGAPGHSPVWLDNDWIVYSGYDFWAGGGNCGLFTIPSWGGDEARQLTTNPTDMATDGTQGIAGVAISDSQGHDATTDNDGQYTISGLITGTYTITASLVDHVFSPPSRVVGLPPDATDQDFIGELHDIIPPDAVSDLSAAAGVVPGSVDLTWTAPGDDGNVGTAMTYTVKYSDSQITSESQWLTASDLTGEPAPLSAGTHQTMTVSGLIPSQTYYFAIRTEDEVPNMSEISNSPGATAKEGPAWTLMYYLAGDNDPNDPLHRLDTGHAWLLNVLRRCEGAADVNVAVMYDGVANNDSHYFAIGDSVQQVGKGEVNTGDPSVLVDFVKWSYERLPADHVALIIAGHGHGENGLAPDYSSGEDFLTMPDLKSAVSQTPTALGKFDIIFMESCLLGTIDAAYQLRDSADYFVASENILWGPSVPRYIDTITGDVTPGELAHNIASSYHDSVMSRSQPCGSTISVARISRVPNLREKVNAFAALLKERMADLGDTLLRLQVLTSVQRFDSDDSGGLAALDDLVDLYDFARLVKEKATEQDLKDAAQAVMDAISDDATSENRYIMANYVNSGSCVVKGRTRNYDLDHSHGVSVFFPDINRSFYNGSYLDFAAGTDWGTGLSQPLVAEETNEWGPMLVEFVKVTNPDAPNDPNPPALVVMPYEMKNVLLPIIVKNQ